MFTTPAPIINYTFLGASKPNPKMTTWVKKYLGPESDMEEIRKENLILSLDELENGYHFSLLFLGKIDDAYNEYEKDIHNVIHNLMKEHKMLAQLKITGIAAFGDQKQWVALKLEQEENTFATFREALRNELLDKFRIQVPADKYPFSLHFSVAQTKKIQGEDGKMYQSPVPATIIDSLNQKFQELQDVVINPDPKKFDLNKATTGVDGKIKRESVEQFVFIDPTLREKYQGTLIAFGNATDGDFLDFLTKKEEAEQNSPSSQRRF